MRLLDGGLELTERQRLVRGSIRDVCAAFNDDYWRECAREGEYPHAFVDRLADDGWLGILVPERYGGAGMGTREAVVMFEEIAASGGGFAAAQAVHGAVYNSVPLAAYGTEWMRETLLPRVADGETSIQAFCLTEPNAGSDSTAMETRAERTDDGWVVNGTKVWTSRLDVSDYAVLVARTTPREDVEKRTRGISMFLVDVADAVDSGGLSYEPIEKGVTEFVHSYTVHLDDLHLPESALVGTEGEGFYQVLDGLNEERLVIAAECLGLGALALERGVQYAGEREVFGGPIGANQAVQHPLAAAFARLQAARHLVYGAARAVSGGEDLDAGAYANAAKYLAAEAAFEAADAAVQTHGGYGVATEYDVERYFREARLARLVPITQELALNYLGERVLGLPRSY